MRRSRARLVTSALLVAGLAAGNVAVSQPASASIRHPYAANEYHRVGDDWRVKTVERDLNANSTVAAGSTSNDKPRAHYRYVLVKVRGQKLSRGSSALDTDERWQLRGRHTKHLYDEVSENLPPEYALNFAVPMHKGEKSSGWLVLEVRRSDIRAGRLLLRVQSYFPSVIKYFRLS